MPELTAAVEFSFATLLLLSAAIKAVAWREPHHALVHLGARSDFAAVMIAAASLFEASISTALVIAPRSLAVHLGIALLFASFAAVGAVALLRNKRIECGCFGSLGGSSLGWRQLVQLPVALVIAFVLLPRAPHFAAFDSFVALAGIQLAGAVVLVASAVKRSRELQVTRVSLESARVFFISQMPSLVGERR